MIDLKTLPKSQRDAVGTIAWGHRHFGSVLTGRQNRRSTVLKLVALGIAESAGQVMVCDGDGFHIEPERWREGFRLTPEGLRIAADAGYYDALAILKAQGRP